MRKMGNVADKQITVEEVVWAVFNRKDVRDAIVKLLLPSIMEQLGQAGVQNVAMRNMSPAILEFGNLKFYPGLEDPNKRKHVHVRSPSGEVKFWLEPLEYDPRGDVGNFNLNDFKKAKEQMEAHHDDFKQDIENLQKGEQVPRRQGQKIKGKNRPKTG